MLSPFARALTYYLGGGFALSLFCGIWYLDQPDTADARWHQRARRRAMVLTSLGVGHPVVALAAVGIALDVGRADIRTPVLLLPATLVSLAVSLVAMMSVLVATS